MNNKKFNKVLAALLAGTMVLGMSVTAFAADESTTPVTTGNTTGTGAFEGHVEKSKLLVQLPTVPTTNPFSYTMDPEGLIAATEGAKDKNATFEAGATVYFLSAANTYTKDSAKLKVVNKGTVDADVTVKAETAANTNVAMAASGTFDAGNENAELYLGLIVANQTAVAVQAIGATTPTSVTVGLKGAPNNYEVKYDETTKKYSYEEKAGVAETAWNSFEFGLTGACNPNGDYSDADLTAADVTVTWSYAKRVEDSTATMLTENATTDAAPSITTTTIPMTAGTALEVSVNLGTGSLKATGIASITFQRDGNAVTVNTSRYTFADNKITFASDWVDQQMEQFETSRDYEVTFNDAAGTKVTLTLTK